MDKAPGAVGLSVAALSRQRLWLVIMALALLAACAGESGPEAEPAAGGSPSPAEEGSEPAAETEAAAEPIRLGCPQTLTGPNALFGEEDQRAIDLFLDNYNASGGVNGRPIELVQVDTGGNADAAATVAERLVTRENVPLLMCETGGSSVTIQVSRMAQRYGVPHVVHTASALDVTGSGWDWVFRLNPMVTHYNDALRDFMLNEVQPASIYHVYENSLFGQGSNDSMSAFAESNGITYQSDPFESGGVDFRAILTRVRDAAPDVVYFTAYVADAVILAQQAAELGLKPQLFATGGAGFIFPEWIEGAGESSEHYFSATLWTPDVPYEGAEEFARDFEEAYGKPPTYESAATYALMQVVADALERAESLDPEGIRAALQQTDLETVYGPVRFETYDEDGRTFTNQNRQIESLLMQVQEGRWVTVWPQSLATNEPVFPVPALSGS